MKSNNPLSIDPSLCAADFFSSLFLLLASLDAFSPAVYCKPNSEEVFVLYFHIGGERDEEGLSSSSTLASHSRTADEDLKP